MAGVDFRIKKNDTRPAIQATLSTQPADVISSVKFNMADKTGALKVNLAAATIVTQPSATAQGVVKYQWQAGNTDTAGMFIAEFQVTYSDARVETYPNDRYLNIEVFADLA